MNNNYEIEIKVNGNWINPLCFKDLVMAKLTYNFYRDAMQLMNIEEMFLISYVGEQRILAEN